MKTLTLLVVTMSLFATVAAQHNDSFTSELVLLNIETGKGISER